MPIAVYHPEHAREYLNDELSVGSLEEPFAGSRGSWGAIAATPEAPAAAPYSPLPSEAAPSAADAEASESAAAGSGAPPTPGLSVALLTIAERLAEHPAVSFNKDPKRTANDKDKGCGRPGGDWSKKPPKGKWTEGVLSLIHI